MIGSAQLVHLVSGIDGSFGEAAYADVRISDAVLFHSRWFVRFNYGIGNCARGISLLSGRQDRIENRRRVSRSEVVRRAGQGGDVHNPTDVNRANLWNDFSVVRPIAWDYQPGPIFVTGRNRCCERGYSNRDCKCVLSAAPLIALLPSGKRKSNGPKALPAWSHRTKPNSPRRRPEEHAGKADDSDYRAMSR
ncbi:MAG: hypothetical protein V7642_1420 [Burkholderiales bacterium]